MYIICEQLYIHSRIKHMKNKTKWKNLSWKLKKLHTSMKSNELIVNEQNQIFYKCYDKKMWNKISLLH